MHRGVSVKIRAMTSREGDRRPGGRGTLAVLAAATLGLAFASGIALVPWLEARGLHAAGVLRLGYAPLCHQLPERSFTVDSRPAAVCARCSGLYVGGVAGMLVAVALGIGRGRRPRPLWLAAAVAPTVAEFALSWLGLPGLANLPRFLLALPAGALAGVFLSIGIHDLFEWRNGTEGIGSYRPTSVQEG